MIALGKRLLKLPLYAGIRHACPVCGMRLRRLAWFQPSPSNPGRRAACPWCGSLERARAIWLYFRQRDLLRGAMLHVSPEACLQRRLRRRRGLRYTTTDLMMPGVDVRASLTDLPLSTNTYDLIYCSNVLEHIPDDAAAMRELFRVLKPGGLAIIQVPVQGETTLEDPTVTTPEERDRLFGQPDHVRFYGRDIKGRLESAGFRAEECTMPGALDLPEARLAYYGVNRRELLHLCTKVTP